MASTIMGALRPLFQYINTDAVGFYLWLAASVGLFLYTVSKDARVVSEWHSCRACSHRLSWLRRVLRTDGFCDATCHDLESKAFSELAVRRLMDDVPADLPRAYSRLPYTGGRSVLLGREHDGHLDGVIASESGVSKMRSLLRDERGFVSPRMLFYNALDAVSRLNWERLPGRDMNPKLFPGDGAPGTPSEIQRGWFPGRIEVRQ